MKRLLDLLAVPATRAPRLVLVALLVLTIGFGLAATRLEVSTDLGDFAPEGGLATTLSEVGDRFGSTAATQVTVDAGPGGDVLTPDVLRAVADLGAALEDDPAVAARLAPEATDRPPVLTFADPFVQAAEAFGVELDELDAATLDQVARTILEDDELGGQLSALFSGDLELDPPRARAGLVVVTFEAGAGRAELDAASSAVADVIAATDAPGLRVAQIDEFVVEGAIEEGLFRDLPLLVSLSLALVLLILGVLFRTVSDVVIGLVGLLSSTVWMVGIAALLGPGGLGLIGPFGQIAVAVPVLLVGLGVDYSVHLTSRYREQQGRGDDPPAAARAAVHTVGVALVLATLATVGGFLSNLATPLPPIADFGVLASVGILASFVILGFGVPASRVLLDGRRSPDVRWRAARAAATDRPHRLAGAGTWLATRQPVAVVVVTVVLVAVAGSAAAGLGTEFEERDFLPEGSAALTLLDRTDELFGGDVGEQTHVVVDADTSDPEVLAAAAAYQDGLSEVDDVRRAGDRAQVTSPFELVDRAGLAGVRVRDAVASDLASWRDPEAALADLPLPDELDAELIERFADDADDPDLPQELLDALERRLPEGRDPAVALALTSDPQELLDLVGEQLRAEVEDDRPAEVTDDVLDALADTSAADLRVETLETAGFPLSTLSDGDLEALRTLDALEDAGWDRDAPRRDGDATITQLEVVAAAEPDELATVLTDDGLLLTVSSSAGQDGAEGLAAELQDRAAPLEAAGATVTVVSNPLVNAEIITSLSDAQMVAILISIAVSAALLVVSTLVSDRSVVLGLIGAAPAATALVFALGSMWVLGMSFNALTATVASIAVGIGVPFGIHLTNRFRSELAEGAEIGAAVHETLRHTGVALTGSAVTTGLAFGVLGLSSSAPLQQFGLISAMMITYALISCLVLQPALLVLWARRRRRRGDGDGVAATTRRSEPVPTG